MTLCCLFLLSDVSYSQEQVELARKLLAEAKNSYSTDPADAAAKMELVALMMPENKELLYHTAVLMREAGFLAKAESHFDTYINSDESVLHRDKAVRYRRDIRTMLDALRDLENARSNEYRAQVDALKKRIDEDIAASRKGMNAVWGTLVKIGN